MLLIREESQTKTGLGEVAFDRGNSKLSGPAHEKKLCIGSRNLT